MPSPSRAPSSAGATRAMDGRAARSARTRTAIIEALLDLLDEGDLRPTAERIAEAAGVSSRSIFLHFADIESLFAEAVDRYEARIDARLRPIDRQATLAGRIDAFTRQRAQIYEAIGPATRAATLQEPFSPALGSKLRDMRRKSRAQIADVFAPELEALPRGERSELLEALAGMASWYAWDTLRDRQRLSRARARRVFVRTLTGLFATA